MDGEAGWWTTSGNIGLPPLARAMGVGRQQQQAHVFKLDSELNSACRAITGCLKLADVEELYFLSRIAPTRVEKVKQETTLQENSSRETLEIEKQLHSLGEPANFSHLRCSEWLRKTNKTPHQTSVNLDESLARGHDSPWTTWRCLSRRCAGYTCSKEHRKKWQHTNAVSRQKTQRTCCNAPSWYHQHIILIIVDQTILKNH